MREFFGSLIFKIGIATLVLQISVLAVFGVYYINRFSQEVESRIEAQIRIPGILMNNGFLNYEAVADRGVMEQIIGEVPLDAMVIGFNKVVFQSLEERDIGKNVGEIPRLLSVLFEGNPNDRVVLRDKDESGNYIATLTPIYSGAGNAPFLFAYIKVGTNELEAQKNELRLLFFLGSLFAAAATSIVTIVAFQLVVLGGIRKLTDASRAISEGRLDEGIIKALPTESGDEVGTLSKSFAQMTVDLKKSRAAIERYSKELEELVASRTEELEKSKQDLVLKVEELERMNKLMVGREIKMIELKNHAKELEDRIAGSGSIPQKTGKQS